MKPRAAEERDDAVADACRLGECNYCCGNIDLQSGRGRRVPLTRCAHHCHRKEIRVKRLP